MKGTATIGPDPICEDRPYPSCKPGVYEARCIGARIYRHPRLNSWKCELEYFLISSGELIFGFFHLGNGEAPKPTRGSEYRRAWIIATGEQPRERQRLTHRAFIDKIFEVRVDFTTRTWNGREHPIQERYSTVKEILRRTWP